MKRKQETPPGSPNQPNLYDIMQIPHDADQAAIKTAYRELILKLHPDKGSTSAEAGHHSFVQLQAAYKTLRDPVLRANYDRQMLCSRQQWGNRPAQPGGKRAKPSPATPKQQQQEQQESYPSPHSEPRDESTDEERPDDVLDELLDRLGRSFVRFKSHFSHPTSMMGFSPTESIRFYLLKFERELREERHSWLLMQGRFAPHVRKYGPESRRYLGLIPGFWTLRGRVEEMIRQIEHISRVYEASEEAEWLFEKRVKRELDGLVWDYLQS